MENDNDAWIKATREGDVEAIDGRIKQGLSQSQLDAALLEVAYRGKEPALKLLLKAGADPRVVNSDGASALFMALLGPSVKCVKALIPLSDLSHRLGDGCAPLMMAARSKSTVALEALITPQRARETDNAGWTPLFFASYYDSIGAMALLMPMSDLQARDALGRTALMAAAQRNSIAAMEALLPHIDYALVDNAGDDAQAVAKKEGSAKAARYLKIYGAVRGERSALEASVESPGKWSPRSGM